MVNSEEVAVLWGHLMLIMRSSVYQYGDSPGANVNKLVWLSESNSGLVGKTERNSCKAEVRLFPSTFYLGM